MALVAETEPHFDMTGRQPAPTDAVLAAPPISQLEALAEKFAPIAEKTVSLAVADRPDVTVRYRVPRDGGQLAAWRRAATGEDGNVDDDLFNRILCVAQCVAVRHAGIDMRDEQGHIVTFRSTALWRILRIPEGSPDGAQLAVKRLYGDNDFEVQGVAVKLLAEGRMGQMARPEADPTPGSSAS